MAVNIATAYLAIVPSMQGLQGNLQNAFRPAEQAAGDAGERAGSSFGSAFKGVLGAAAALGVATSIKDFAETGVKSLARIEKINTQTENVIRSTGGAAQVSAEHVEDLAGQMENLTASEAETVQQGANFLLTFKDIKNGVGDGNDIFDQTVKIMNDMSVATGQDMQGAALQLGKALNDPIKGLSALSRVGVSFTEEQKKQIETLQESGDIMGAQKIILQELNSEFGGSGLAYGKTIEGQMKLLGHAFGTFQESVMTRALPAVSAFSTAGATLFNDAAAWVDNFKLPEAISAGWEAMKSIVAGGEGDFAAIGGPDSFLGQVSLRLYGLNENLHDVWLPQIKGTMTEAWSILSAGDFQGGNGLEEDSPIVGFLFGIRDVAKEVVASIGPIFQQIGGALGPVFTQIGSTLGPAVVETFGKLWDAISPLVPTVLQLVSAFNPFSLIFKALEPVLPKIVDLVAQLVQSLGGVLAKAIEKVGPLLEKLVGAFMDFVPVLVDALMPILPVIVDVLTDLAGVIGDALGAALDAVAPLIQTVVDVVADLLPFVAELVRKLLPPLAKLFESIAPLLSAVLDALMPLVSQIADALIPVIESLMPIVERVFTFIADTINNVVTIFQGVIDFVTGVFSGDWDKAWQGVKDIFGGIWDQIKNIFSTLWDVIVEFFTNLGPRLWDIVTGLAGQLVEWGGQFLGWIWQGIQDLWNGTIWPWFASLPGLAWEGIKAAAGQLVEWGGEFLSWLWSGITSFFTDTLGPWFASLPQLAWDALIGFVGAAGGWLVDRGSDFIGWIVDGITSGAESIWSWFTSLPTTIWNFILGIKDKIIDLGKGFVSWIVDGIKSAASAVADAVTGLFNLQLNEDGTGYVGVQGYQPGFEPGVVMGGSARGGVIPGRDPGRRDNVLGRLPSGAGWGLRSEEAVMVPDFTHAVGGAAGVYRLNRLAEAGRLGEIMGGFAFGGVVPKAKEIGRWVSEGIAASIKTDGGSPLWDHIGDDARSSAGKSTAINVDPGSARGRFIAAMLSKQGTSYVWGAAGPDVFDCSGLVSWALEQAGVGKGRLTAEGFNSSFPRAPEAPGNLVTFDTGRLPGHAGHIGAIVDVARGLMMHTDGAGPARISDYKSRDGGPLSIIDAIGGGVASGSSSPFAGILSKVTGIIQGAWNNAVGPSGETPGGTGVERWRSLGLQVLTNVGKYLGRNLTQYIDEMLLQISTESSGNPAAINLWDSNAMRGTPSKGLMQVIDPTAATALRGTPFEYLLSRGMFDPEANMTASTLYGLVTGPYHDLAKAWRGVAYRNGGMVPPLFGRGIDSVPAMLTPDESVLTPPQTEAYQAVGAALEAGFWGGELPPINVYVDGLADLVDVRVEYAQQDLVNRTRQMQVQGR